MALNSVQQLVDAELNGRVRINQWRKAPSQVTSAGYWFDLSMSPGNPVPKYWFDAPPAVAKAISQSADGGLFHGANTTPYKQYLRMTTAMSTSSSPTPMPMILCDYLLYYPSIDDSVTDPQVLDNTVTLPRYTTGEGVQILPVTVAGRTGGATFTVTYTNSQGVGGRTSQLVVQNTISAIGTIATAHPSNPSNNNSTPFVGLQQGDTGVRSIESVTMLTPDVGLFALILVKPLATTAIYSITAPSERDYFLETSNVPEIKDDAFLTFICNPNGSLSGTILTGDIKIIYN